MNGGLIERVEIGVGRGASAIFAGAVGYAVYGVAATLGVDPQLSLSAAGAGVLAYLPCSRVLVGGRRGIHFVLSDFALRDFEFAEVADELLLTDADRLTPTDELLLTDVDRLTLTDELLLTDADRVDAPLELDDILAELGPESRVVRLFDRKSMPRPAPTPGQLHARIADHLGDGTPRSVPSNLSPSSDASQALSAALAELRRSLR